MDHSLGVYEDITPEAISEILEPTLYSLREKLFRFSAEYSAAVMANDFKLIECLAASIVSYSENYYYLMLSEEDDELPFPYVLEWVYDRYNSDNIFIRDLDEWRRMIEYVRARLAE